MESGSSPDHVTYLMVAGTVSDETIDVVKALRERNCIMCEQS